MSSIDLTREQQKQIDRDPSAPTTVRDPRSDARYVLIPFDTYEQMVEIIEDDAEQRALRRAAARGAARRLAGEQA